MATLSEHQGQLQAQGNLKNEARGQTSRALGGKSVVATTPVKSPAVNVVGKATAVAKQTFNIAATLGKKTGSYVVNADKDIGKQFLGAMNALHPDITRAKNYLISRENKQLENKQKQVVDAYRSGAMSKENYVKSMKELSDGFQGLSKRSQQVQAQADPKQNVSDLGWTAINILSVGRLTPIKTAVVSGGGEVVARNALSNLLTKGALKIEEAITKVPAARELMDRNIQTVVRNEARRAAGESLEDHLIRSGRDIAVGLLIKRPVFYQTNVGLANETYDHIIKGEYGNAAKSAAWIGAQMVGGGPIGYFMKQISGGFKHLGVLAKGQGSFIDEISKEIGNNNPAQIARFLDTMQQKAPKEFAEAEKTFRIIQETNLRIANGDLPTAVENVLTHYRQHGIDLRNITPSQLYKDMSNWAKADELAQKTLRSGLVKNVLPEEANKYVVIRLDSTVKKSIADAVRASDGTLQGISNAIQGIADNPGVGFGNNNLFMSLIDNIVNTSSSKEEIAKRIMGISTASTMVKGMPKKIAQQLADLGFSVAEPYGSRRTPIVSLEDTRKLITGAIKGDKEIFDPAISPKPVLASIANALTRFGLSPESNNEIAARKLSQSIVSAIDDTGVISRLSLTNPDAGDLTNGGRAILSQLQHYIDNKRGAPFFNKIASGKSAVIDVRQLTPDEVVSALNITMDDAKKVTAAIREGYMQVPLEFRGLGDKVVDYAMAPKLSPMRYYSRIQSALRYTYNPFFRTQERFETAALAKMNANKFIWLKSKGELDNAVSELEKAEVFHGKYFGIGAEDNIIGRIKANITQPQKRNLAGLALTIAERQGKTLTQVLRDSPEQIDDALRVIVQYPRQGAISSPLARTLNIAFFPIRYNAKVTMLAAQELAKAPPSVQLATLQGLFKMNEWLQSDEGIRWRAEHADALQVWGWVSPVGNITSFMKLMTGNVNSLGDLGLLGGLPFGVISQILDGQGIINLNKPYVDPKTGDVLPDYIPQTTRARAAVALNDLLNSMFSFPGRTLGLPGKESTLRKGIDIFIDTNGKDFDKQVNLDQLTPAQRNYIRVLKGDTSEETINSLYTSAAPGQFNYYTLPSPDIPGVRPLVKQAPLVERRTGLPKKAAKGRKAKRPKTYAKPLLPNAP